MQMIHHIDKLYIIDTTSPFFVRKVKKTINWSKIPYNAIEKNGIIRRKDYKKIRSNFETYIKRIASLGYNAISVDQLCYLVNFDFYSKKTKRKIFRYQSYFSQLFSVAKERGLKIFINTDVIFTNKQIDLYTNGRFKNYIDLLKHAIEALFHVYPEVDGVNVRIGEADGVDVKGTFRSKIIVKTPRQANSMIKTLLPTFEEMKKHFIFRTWTVGAYPIGDMMWNYKTYDAVFGDIESDSFIVSMKYGDTDFFRYVELNELFYHGNHRKLLELQTRREYEGFGEYPSFIGWDYHRIYERVNKLDTFAGVHVWCQTGGWSRFSNITFSKDTSYWNELNTAVTIKLFKDGATVENAVAAYAGNKGTDDLMEFLRLSEEGIKNVLYDPEIASQELYFNNVRIPPLVHVFWDYVTITEFIISFCNLYAKNGSRSIENAEHGLMCVRKMKTIGEKLNLPYDYEFHYDTFELFNYCRKMIYSVDKETIFNELMDKISKYRVQHPGTYHFRVSLTPKNVTKNMHFILNTFTREGKNYRPVDQFLFNRFTAVLFRIMIRMTREKYPAFIDKQSMSLDALFS